MLGNIFREATMTKAIPVVRQALLNDPMHAGVSIPLDSPAWFAWLEAPTTTRFSYALFNRARGYIDGFLTVRKERRQRGGAYWSVYRRRNRQVCKVYVGPSTALTQARLEQIAACLHTEKGE
jgi:LuxR family transcriptional regulator, maltose regulon positive regulatory protein